MDTPIKKAPVMVVIQGGTTPETLPAAIEQIAALRVQTAELEQLGQDVKVMGTLLAHLMGQAGLLEVLAEAKGEDFTLRQKMRIAKKMSGAVMDALDKDSELRKLFQDPNLVEPFKRVMAYASTR